MSGWETLPLGDLLVEAKPGFACGEDPSDGVFQFRMNNVTTEGQLDLSRKRRVPKNTRNLESYLVKPGDVLFNATNSPELVGKSAFFAGDEEPSVFSNHFLRLRPSAEKVDGRFLARWLALQFQRRVFQGMCRQWVNQATVGRESLLALRVPVPPLAEQLRIAAILDQADAMRAKRRATLAQLDILTQAIFLDLFGDPTTNPRGWPDSKTLGEIADIVSGVTKGRDPRGNPVREVPYMAVVNVQDRALDLSVVKTIEATEDEVDRYRLLPNDLLLTEGGDPDKLGRGTLWNSELPECIHQNHIFRVRITSPDVHPLFLNWLVGSQRGKRYFLRSAKQTTGIASINMTQLRSFPMLFPPFALQLEFARRIAVAENLKDTYRTSLAKLETLFAALQQRAFDGEL